MDSDGRILDANTTFARLVGMDLPSVIDAGSLANLLTPGSRVMYLSQHVPQLQRGGSVAGALLELRRADGTVMPALVTASISEEGVESGTETTRRIVATLVDATHRAVYEAELLTAAQRAETVASRLAVLHAVVAACAQTNDAREIAAAVVDAVKTGFAAYECAVWLPGGDAGSDACGGLGSGPGVLRRVAGRSEDVHLMPETVDVESAEPVGQAWRSAQLSIARSVGPDAQTGIPETLRDAMSAAGVDEKIAVPLTFESSVRGVLGLYLRRPERTSDDELMVLRTVGVNVGQSLERAHLHAELERRATHDALTGLFNRAALLERMSGAIARAARSGDPLAVLVIDLDGFKAVNDRLGHQAGDDLLVEVAQRLRAATRPGDVVARLGGDEFVVVCERVDDAGAASLAARVTAALDVGVTVGTLTQTVSGSVGVCVHSPSRSVGNGDPHAAALVDAATLLGRADHAMYRVKRAR